jgi:hypothetical protein
VKLKWESGTDRSVAFKSGNSGSEKVKTSEINLEENKNENGFEITAKESGIAIT